MAYYLTGDYYRGDYYRRRGDPGLFSAIGSVIKGAVSIGAGFLTGGPGGALRAGAGLVAGPRLPASPPGQGGLVLPGGVMISPQRIIPGGAPFVSRQGGGGQPGYHLDKKNRSKWVRNRSMNPANPRALRRAVRREHAFVALAKRVLRGTGISIGRRSFGSRKKIGGRR